MPLWHCITPQYFMTLALTLFSENMLFCNSSLLLSPDAAVISQSDSWVSASNLSLSQECKCQVSHPHSSPPLCISLASLLSRTYHLHLLYHRLPAFPDPCFMFLCLLLNCNSWCPIHPPALLSFVSHRSCPLSYISLVGLSLIISVSPW